MRGAVHEWSSFDICAYKPHFRFDLQGWSRSKRPGLTVHPGGPRLRPGARRVLVSEIGLRQDTAWTTSTNTITETTQETGTKRDAQESYSRKRTSQVFAQQPARPRADINGLDRGNRVRMTRDALAASRRIGLYCASSHHAKSTRPSAPIIFNHLRRHHLQIPPTHNRGSLSALRRVRQIKLTHCNSEVPRRWRGGVEEDVRTY